MKQEVEDDAEAYTVQEWEEWMDWLEDEEEEVLEQDPMVTLPVAEAKEKIEVMSSPDDAADAEEPARPDDAEEPARPLPPWRLPLPPPPLPPLPPPAPLVVDWSRNRKGGGKKGFDDGKEEGCGDEIQEGGKTGGGDEMKGGGKKGGFDAMTGGGKGMEKGAGTTGINDEKKGGGKKGIEKGGGKKGVEKGAGTTGFDDEKKGGGKKGIEKGSGKKGIEKGGGKKGMEKGGGKKGKKNGWNDEQIYPSWAYKKPPQGPDEDRLLRRDPWGGFTYIYIYMRAAGTSTVARGSSITAVSSEILFHSAKLFVSS